MKKTTLSLAISLLLFNSHTPAFAVEDFENDTQLPLENQPPQDYPPLDQYGDLPPLDENHELPPLDGNHIPPYDENRELPPEGDAPPPHDRPPLDDFGLSPDQFEFFDADDIKKIDPEAFAAFKPADLAHLPPGAMPGFTPEQFAQIDRDALERITKQQFDQLPPEALGNMHPDNIGGFEPDVLNQLRPEHFQQFNSEQFEQADSKDVFRIFTNSDPKKIQPEDVRELLPNGWTMNEDGLIELPEGEGFVLPPMSRVDDLSPDVVLPDEIPDLNNGLGLGGQGEPMIDGLNDALKHAKLPQFNIKQDAKGIMQVTGSDEFEGVNLAFIPDMENMKQGDSNAVPGISQNERGLFVLTTPDGQMMLIRPVPKDIEAIKNLLPIEGAQVNLGDEGDVLIRIPEHNGHPAMYGAGIFDPMINPAQEGLKPGIHIPNDSSGLEPATIVYEDGTSQIMKPTVPSPKEFVEKAKEFAGVDNIQYNGNGSISLTYEGNKIMLNPTFNVKVEPLPADTENVEPSITLLDGGFLEYRIQQDGQVVVFKVKINFQ